MKKKIIYFLSIVLLILICVIIIISYNNSKSLFIKPDFDPLAISEKLQVPEKLKYASIDISKGYKVYLCGDLIMDEFGKVPIYFKSDENNNVYIKFRIYDKENNLLKESGLIKPGETIQQIEMGKRDKETEVVIKVMGYDRDNYYSMGVANINAKICYKKNL